MGALGDPLAILYQRMAEITSPLCAGGVLECSQFKSTRHRCCERRFCDLAARFAREHYGVDLQPTGNPELPFMGEHGCVVPPHLRPICTLHVCSVTWADRASIENDPAKTAAFLDLQRQTLTEARRQGKVPVSCP